MFLLNKKDCLQLVLLVLNLVLVIFMIITIIVVVILEQVVLYVPRLPWD